MSKATVTIKEIATSLGLSESQTKRRASSEGWRFEEQVMPQGGKRRLYPVSALPDGLKETLVKRSLKAVQKNVLPPMSVSSALDLKAYQRERMEARAILLAEIDQIVLQQGVGKSRAVEMLCGMATRRELSPDLQRLVPIANARSNGDRGLSRATVYNWLAERDAAGGEVLALAGKVRAEAGVPEWAVDLLKLRQRPTNPGLAECLEQWPEGVPKPSYDQARRFVKRLDTITRNAGRMGPRALAAFRVYHLRDTSELWPGAIFIGDGHTYKAEIAHPIHGRPFRPEITSILDVYTRRWVGWSAALAENTWSVADAVRHAATTTTQCDILYYDNGSGANNETWDNEVTGLAARLGFVKMNSAPWTSQSRGIIEHFHSTILHKAARALPTYVGERMDKEARERSYKITRKEIKESGVSKLLPRWDDFIAEMSALQATYNARPHSSLSKIVDPLTGKRRHMSPDEMWAAEIAKGWVPDPVSEEVAATLFRPAVPRKTKRGLVSWIDNFYFHPALEALGGEYVQVAYDIHDASKVWVSLMDGRFVCEATWNGHKTAYVPKSFAEHAHEKRIAGRIKRAEAHVEAARLEGNSVIDTEIRTVELLAAPHIDPELLAAADREFERLSAAPTETPVAVDASGRPVFFDDFSWITWLIEHPEGVDDQDRENVRATLKASPSLRFQLETAGIAPTTLAELITNTAKVA